MFVDHLQLADFRSYPRVDVGLAAGVSIFVGANGQGKTNLVEAIEYLSTLSSHRVSTEVPLVRAGTERAVIRARVQAGPDDLRQLQLELEITPGKANRAKLNRSPLPRAREILGVLRTVVFAPDDLAIVKGDPAERRRFIDELVVARWPRMAGVRADYERVLRQRNTLLKSLNGRGGGAPRQDAASTLDVWDDHCATVGAQLLAARLDTLAELMPYVSLAYADIAPTNNRATAAYKTSVPLEDESELVSISSTDVSGVGPHAPSVERCDSSVEPAETADTSARSTPARHDRAGLTDLLRSAMRQRRSEEIQRGVCLVGPHRDDITLTLGELPAKGYASHGESWSYALALKLGSFHLLRADGIEPVLLLDDVFAELDVTRRCRLAAGVQVAEQVLVTAAVGADVPDTLAGSRFTVADGEVAPDAG